MSRSVGFVWVSALIMTGLVAGPAAGQSSFGWRVGVGADYGEVRSAGPFSTSGQKMAVYSASLERSVTPRIGLGLEWTGAYFDGPDGREQRQALTLNASVRAWRGLRLTAGAGPGVASWRTVEGPPENGVGDVLIDFSDGDSALALAFGLGYDVSLGAFQVTPGVRWIEHRLNGVGVSMAGVGVALSLRTGA